VAAYTGVVAVAVQNVAPALAGVLNLRLGWNAREIGAFASADSMGIFLGGLLAAALMLRLSFRTLTAGGMAVLAVANLISVLDPSPSKLIAIRLIGGVGGGVALAISFSVFAGSRPERAIATWSVGQLAFGLLGITATPILADLFSWRAPFLCLCALTLGAFPLLHRLPGTAFSGASPAPTTESGSLEWTAVIAVLGVGLFFFGQGCLWPYLELIGLRSGIDQKSVESSLSLSAVSALLGSVLVLTAGIRFGRTLPLLGSFAITLTALFTIGIPDAHVFRAALGAFTFAWPVFGSYQFAVIASGTRSARVGALITAATFAGTMLSPIVAGVISDRSGFRAVVAIAAILDSLALASLLPLLRRPAP
jgi:predicted MFS family arabinose efflux permease